MFGILLLLLGSLNNVGAVVAPLPGPSVNQELVAQNEWDWFHCPSGQHPALKKNQASCVPDWTRCKVQLTYVPGTRYEIRSRSKRVSGIQLTFSPHPPGKEKNTPVHIRNINTIDARLMSWDRKVLQTQIDEPAPELTRDLSVKTYPNIWSIPNTPNLAKESNAFNLGGGQLSLLLFYPRTLDREVESDCDVIRCANDIYTAPCK